MRWTTGKTARYSEALADAICEAIATSDRGMEHICRENKSFPHPDTVHSWRDKYPEFGRKYARAKEMQAERLAFECLAIADDGSSDYTETERGEVFNPEHVQRSRLRFDARRWLAGKLAPKTFGDKIQHSGDADSPLVVQLVKFNEEDIGQ